MDHEQEQDLIRAAQKGDRNALGTLYDVYADKIYRYLFYRLDDRVTAEDLTAEVFLNLVEGLKTYKVGDSPLLAWLYRVAHARLIDYYRRQSRIGEQSDIEDVILPIEDDSDGSLMGHYHHEKLHTALNKLTSEQKQVIILRFMEDQSLQETADAMGKSVGAIKVMQFRALQALSRLLGDEGVTRES